MRVLGSFAFLAAPVLGDFCCYWPAYPVDCGSCEEKHSEIGEWDCKPEDGNTWCGSTPTPSPGPSPVPGPDPGPSWYKTITPSGDGDICIDLPGGDVFNGNPLWLWECNGAESQVWVFDNYQLRYGLDENFCIDAGDASAGKQMFLWECNGQDQQTWGYDNDAARVYLAGTSTCLDWYDQNYDNGQALHVWECNGHSNQEWSLWNTDAPWGPGPAPSPVPGPDPGPAPPPVPGPDPASGCGSGWEKAQWTTYDSYPYCCPNNPNYDPHAPTDECDDFSGCKYSGQFAYISDQSYEWVKSHDIIAFFSSHGDNKDYAGKTMRVSAFDQSFEVLVADTCGDGDCDGCCTEGAKKHGGYLVDMEGWTVMNHYGRSLEDLAGGESVICWQLVGADVVV